MTMTDPIADMLTRIRNASSARKAYVDIPKSKLKLQITRVLKSEGFIDDFKIGDVGVQGFLRLFLKYSGDREGVIRGIKRASRPGRRMYVGTDEIPRILGGMGIAIVSTSKGVMTDKQSRTERLGGELLCYIW